MGIIPTPLLGSQRYLNDIMQYTSIGLVEHIVRFVIDRRYKKAVELKKWLKEQIDNKEDMAKLKKIAEENELISIVDGNLDYDKTMIRILKYVNRVITYKTDQENFKTIDLWKKGIETHELKVDDCEGGATLIYVLARAVGIPKEHMYIWTGQTIGGGHACLIYRPTAFILNYTFLDWCFYPDTRSNLTRNKFILKGKIVAEYAMPNGRVSSNYLETWFIFNESYAHRGIYPTWKRV